MKKFLWVLLGLCFAFTIDEHPVSIVPGSIRLEAPVRNAVSISGSFGELRYNHFHHGIDLRSIGPGGDEILATADGYVSKIIIDAEDLGKTLYITHPNGLVSVYAHLDRFREDIENRIRDKQFQEKLYQVQLDLDPDQLTVKQGEMVAWMGNTGASRGKHLHFELRDHRGEEVWDPLLFGFPIEDNRAPQIHRVKISGYDLDGNEVHHQVYPVKTLAQHGYRIQVPGESFSVSVDASDFTDRSHFRTGIKSIHMRVDGELQYQFVAEKWKRSDTKYINAHIDPGGSGRRGQGRFHRCYLLRGNCLGLYHSNECRGYMVMNDSAEHQVKLLVADASGNSNALDFSLKKTAYQATSRKGLYKDTLFYDQAKTFVGKYSSLTFQDGSVYEDLNCQMKEVANENKASYSGWTGVAPFNAYTHFPVQIKIKPAQTIPESLRSKCFIAQKMGKSYKNVGGIWDGDYLTASNRSMGPYCIMIDTVAPKITMLKPKRKRTTWKALKFKMYDNFTASKEMPDLHYEAYIDQQWVIMEYDKKAALLTYAYEPWLGKGKHEYKILLRDQLGNERTYTGYFVL